MAPMNPMPISPIPTVRPAPVPSPAVPVPACCTLLTSSDAPRRAPASGEWYPVRRAATNGQLVGPGMAPRSGIGGAYVSVRLPEPEHDDADERREGAHSVRAAHMER